MFKNLHLRSLMLAMAFVAFFPSSTSADPVTAADVIWVVSGPTEVFVTVTHVVQAPPGTSAVATQTSPGGFWALTLTGVTETDTTVRIVGSIRHLMSPPGHAPGLGPLFNFDLTVSTVIPRLTDVDTFRGMHEVHFDVFTATLTGVRAAGPGNNIGSFTLSVEGGHVPEPTTILLLGTGLAGVVIKTRKKLKSRDKGPGNQ
jgi:PEP-CTERM motif